MTNDSKHKISEINPNHHINCKQSIGTQTHKNADRRAQHGLWLNMTTNSPNPQRPHLRKSRITLRKVYSILIIIHQTLKNKREER